MWSNQTDGIYVADIESIELSELNGRLNTERLSQVLLNLNFLNIDLNSSGLIVINTNMSLNEIIKSEKLIIFKDLVDLGKDIIFKERLSYTDSIYVVKQFREFCEISNLKFFLKDKLFTFLERNYFDPSKVASIGLTIKNSELNSNKDFQKFSADINNSLKRPLRVPQLKSSYHFIKLKRVMNFSVPGSGKTATILGSFQYLKKLGLASRIIVFCPLNAFSAWRSEYIKVIPNANENHILDISEIKDKNYAETYIDNQFKRSSLVLINFERIKSIKDYLEGLFSYNDIIVYDEIHRLKKTDSEKVIICKSITKETNYRCALSGTPFPNGYQDLSNLFELIFEDHASSYFGIDSKMLRTFDKGEPSNNRTIANFNTKIFPFYIRITKKDLEVPEANEDEVIEIMIDGYDKVIELKKKSSNYLALIPKLIQYTSIPSLIYNKINGDDLELDRISDVLISITEPITNKKSTALLNLLLKNNRKTIVWCSYVNSILYLEKLLKLKGIKTHVIYGSTDQIERNRIIDEFNSNSRFEVLITNPNTLAESVSLHYNCHDAIYYEISYNLSFFLQSKDRIHRLGLAKEQKTNYYILVTLFDNGRYSLDRNILHSVVKKEATLLNSIQNNIYVSVDEIINPLDVEKLL
jgi:superfamily II DNA or RNA helicase